MTCFASKVFPEQLAPLHKIWSALLWQTFGDIPDPNDDRSLLHALSFTACKCLRRVENDY